MNPLQFAVVREDPEVEIALFDEFQIEKPVMIGSGGCTALTLASVFPEIELSLIEPNINQIELIKSKVKVLERRENLQIKRLFSIGGQQKERASYVNTGNFESLFRQFRLFLFEFVLGEIEFARLLQRRSHSAWQKVFENPYWPVAFDLFFSDSILKTMFGKMAIQHAPEGSYPEYFRKVLERGLLIHDGRNYFLHHIFLGYYLHRKNCLPRYLQRVPRAVKIQFLNSMAEDVPSYESYDFVGLSNIFDWCSEKQIRLIAKKLRADLRPGSVLLFRQLNNQKSFTKLFGADFVWKSRLARKLWAKDRSLFYSSLHIGVRK